jgi:hypothetical protein
MMKPSPICRFGCNGNSRITTEPVTGRGDLHARQTNEPWIYTT